MSTTRVGEGAGRHPQAAVFPQAKTGRKVRRKPVLGLPLHRVAPNGQFAEFNIGSTHIALYTKAAMSDTLGKPVSPLPDRHDSGFEFAFKVENADASFAEAVEPTTRFWGQRTAHMRDPNGHLIELAQELKPGQ